MTFFTFAGKCGGFGAVGLASLAGSADSSCSPSSDASAILPTPTPQRLKKCRRVSNWRSLSSGVIVCSLPCHEIVQIEEYPAQRRPGGHLRNALGVHVLFTGHCAVRRGIEDLFLHHQQACRRGIGTELVALQREEPLQPLPLRRVRLAAARSLAGVGQAFGVIGGRFLSDSFGDG